MRPLGIRFLRLALAALLALFAVAALPHSAAARVVRVTVDRREPIAGRFGSAGAYERVTGRIYFAFDARDASNRQIVDLALAPRNAAGEVEAWSEFVLLRPADATKGSGVTLVDVVNRGNMTVGVFHLGERGGAPTDSAFYGDALLLRRGLSVLMIGWQWDILPGAGPLHFHPPVAQGPNGTHLTGLVRSDITIDAPARAIPLGHRVGASQALGYPVAGPDDAANVLTVRDAPLAPRTVVPRSAWRFEGRDSVSMAGGFEAGKIYEVVYRAADPVVVGTGLAAVRDVASWLKHDATSLAPTRYTVAYGVSQTGRFLRHFLYQGFNVDERGRRAFDGVFAHTAGAGRGSFNHRFAQPSRDAQPYSTFFYPTDLPPFTSRRVAAPPKVFYVDGGYEYWGRAASLTHTTPDGLHDVGFAPNERRYVINSAQHSSPAAFPPTQHTDSPLAWRGDPMDQRLALRALLVALVDWVQADRVPPPSTYPTLASRTLVRAESLRAPAIPGVTIARTPYQPARLDLGAGWSRGLIDGEPPRVGALYPVLVPRVDSFGNDLGGVRSVELRAPLATYFPWQLRGPGLAAPERLVSFAGTFVPLPRTEAERRATGDPRPSLERLYGSRDAYLARADAQAKALVAQRFLLPGDTAAAHARLAATWDWIAARPAVPTAPNGSPSDAEVDRIMAAYARPDGPGAAVLVVRDGRTVLARGYGLADVEARVPVTPQTNFRLASLTKQFTATLVMRLAADGWLRYDDVIGPYFDALPAWAYGVTIRQLLNHTSGLPDYEDFVPNGAAQVPQVHDADVPALIANAKGPYFAPGTQYRYSNTGYALLALVASRPTGKRFADLLRDRLFTPLGMSATLAREDAGPPVTRRAFGYTLDSTGAARRTDQSSTSAVLGDGGVYTSLDDLARWDAAIARHALVTADAQALAWTPPTLPAPQTTSYGFGWVVDRDTTRGRSARRVTHHGESRGFTNAVVRYPDEGLAVWVLTNRTGGAPWDAAQRIADLYRTR